MGRPKGSGKKAEKPIQDAQEAVHGTESTEQAAEAKEPEAGPEMQYVYDHATGTGKYVPFVKE